MKKNKAKLFPPMLMLIAGSITSIMTYRFQYEIKAALLILLSVLLFFYLLGLIIVKIIARFDQINEEKRLAEEQMAIESEENSEESEEDLERTQEDSEDKAEDS
ncbi:MAG: hypothetical protein ACI4VG_04485 [Lachnospiraceae bacterium]